MASLQNLHQLIHSLDKYEKIQVSTNIKALARKSKDSYMNDYQYIVKNKVYDKTKIKEGLLKIDNRKNLSESNTNLYNFICDTLIKIRLNKNKKIGLLRDIQQVEMLYEKGLIDQSDKNLQKLKAKSLSLGEDIILQYLLNNEDKILIRKKINLDRRIEHLEDTLLLSKQIQNKLEFKILKRKVYALASSVGTPRTKDHNQKYIELFNNPLLVKVENALTKDSIYEFYDLKILLSMIISDKLDKTLSLIWDAINEIQKIYDVKTNVSPEFYLRLYSIEVSANYNNKETLIKSIDGLKSIEKYVVQEVHSKIIKTKIIWAWLTFYSKNKKYKEAYSYLQDVKELILDEKTNKLSAFNYINIYFAACICFFNEKHDESLSFIEILLNRKKTIRQSILSHIHSLYLLNHFKLNNTEYLPYAVKSVYRSFLNNKILYEPEKELIHFFKTTENPLNIKKALNALYIKFKKLEEDKLNYPFFDNGIYMFWLENELK